MQKGLSDQDISRKGLSDQDKTFQEHDPAWPVKKTVIQGVIIKLMQGFWLSLISVQPS